MFKSSLALALLLIVSLATSPRMAFAQTPGNCQQGVAENDLDLSDVFARVFNTGSLFFGNSTVFGDGYYVPKATSRSPLFAAGIWIGGTVNGEIRVAGARYERFEFWPGPLDAGATLPDPNDCSPFDRIYVVSTLDVDEYEATGTATPDLADWPVGLGAPTVDINGDPVIPVSRDQVVDLAAGERPVIYGSQTSFWVMNDVGNIHIETGSNPLGVEVQVSAFEIADASAPSFFQGTFYRYMVINRSNETIDNAFVTFFTDPDLGDAADDYIGSDPSRSMSFAYNASNTDATYGTPPPAVGFDLLSGAASAAYFCNSCPEPGTTDPRTKEEYYNMMQGLWKDGVPLTEGGSGYMTGGAVTPWAFSGDPEAQAFWSMVNSDGAGTALPPNDQRVLISTPSFSLAPGDTTIVDVAILFALGSDYLNSVTQLKGASDVVQARYDAGTLFDTVEPNIPDPPTEAPDLLSPDDGAVFESGDVMFSWTAVANVDFYALQISTTPGFESPLASTTTGTSILISPDDLPQDHADPFYWRVKGVNSGGEGPYSAVRTFTYYIFVPDWAGQGDGIVEISYPGIPDVCDGAPADPGCQMWGGNTVWRDGNANDDYYVAAGGGAGDLLRISRYIEAASPDDFEIRFTAAGGLAVYGFAGFEITSVPFELWNIGETPDDPADDVRMIPFLNNNDTVLIDWENEFTGVDPVDGVTPITDWVYFLMPDRPNGYDLFEQAAMGFGGAGAVYDPASDGDTQIDIDPFTGLDCSTQGAYVDYCYRNQDFVNNPGPSSFIYPIGRTVYADLAGDGTTPPEGTVIRFITTKPIGVANEPDGPEEGLPRVYSLLPTYPNPFNPRAVVPFVVPEAGHVRLTVVDILGREIATLLDGEVAAGRHEAVLDGGRLASGIYLVRLEAGGVVHATQKVLLLR